MQNQWLNTVKYSPGAFYRHEIHLARTVYCVFQGCSHDLNVFLAETVCGYIRGNKFMFFLKAEITSTFLFVGSWPLPAHPMQMPMPI